jgi:trans-2,3-dihydro-3-hydroxyanthranilate isomerase
MSTESECTVSQRSSLELCYQLCDVFTSRPYEGNQLAVFENAAGLTSEEMQALARETNLSETTFVIPRDASTEREQGVRVRIFTTQEELPFAGHPTLGTATMLRRILPRYAEAESIVLDLNAGRIPVRFDPARNDGSAVYGEMTQRQPVFGALHERAPLARALGLTTEDLASGLNARTVSTGMPFCVVPLRSLDVLSRLRIPQSSAENYLATSDAKFFYCIAPTGIPGEWRARMQFYNGEDPATGSAAGCAISWMVAQEVVASGARVHIRQGVEIHRPSDIYVSAKWDGANATEVRVGGSTVPVANGRFFLERFT